MAAGELEQRLTISPRHDALDAIAHAINVLVGELSWAGARAKEAQEEKAAQLRAAIESAETRSSAILRAIPDLMFVMSHLLSGYRPNSRQWAVCSRQSAVEVSKRR